MKPLLYEFQTFSSVELNEPNIVYATSITTLEPENRNVFVNSDNFVKSKNPDDDISKFEGTSLSNDDMVKCEILKDDLVGFYCDDYDIVVKIPVTTISKKVKIKRITSVIPRIIL